MKFRVLLPLGVAAAAALAGACGDESSSGDGGGTCAIEVDRFKELMVVDEAVLSDPRTRNATGGAWSFRHALEGLLPEGKDHSRFILSWVENWATTTELNGFKTDLEPRAPDMNSQFVCPWLKQTPSNQCDDVCGVCAARELDLSKAPFRTVAIVNRTELSRRPDRESPAGEARIVFGLTKGPGDDPASEPLAMGLIFEYGLPVGNRTPKQWYEAWHHLGTHKSFDEAYKSELAALTEGFVARGSDPTKVNGSSIAQVRTNESAFNWIWQMREFRLNSTGDLRLAPLHNTPGEALNNSASLQRYILANQAAILDDTNVLPPSMLAGSADQLRYRWQAPEVPENLRVAFARTTCNGCHSGENPVIDVAFHISPYRKGTAKLSEFLFNPAAPEKDELGRRTAFFKENLCSKE